MPEGLVDLCAAVPADDEPAEFPHPREGALDLPASPVASERSAVLRRRPLATRAVRGDELDALAREVVLERVFTYGTRDSPTRSCAVRSSG